MAAVWESRSYVNCNENYSYAIGRICMVVLFQIFSYNNAIHIQQEGITPFAAGIHLNTKTGHGTSP